MQRNVKLFPIYKVFSYDILFYFAISILFLTNTKRFDLSQVALISSIYSISAIIFQIPASIIADKIGLRTSMIIGNIFCMLWGIFYIIFPSFTMILVAEAISAFGFALKGASESPFIYSSLSELNRTSEFTKVEGKGSSFYFILEAIASIVAGYLFFINSYLPLLFSTTCFLLATILAFCMKSVKTHENDVKAPKERFADMINGFKFILKSKRLHALLLFAGVFWGIVDLSILYIETLYNDINVHSTTFGYIFAAASIASAVGAAVQDKIEKKNRNKTLSVISITYVLSFVVIGLLSLIFNDFNLLLFVGIVVFLLQSLIKGAYSIIIIEYISRYTTSSIRSKLMSIYFLLENFGSALLLFIASKTIELVPIGVSYCISGFILFIIFILILNYMTTRVGLNPNSYGKEDRMDLQ